MVTDEDFARFDAQTARLTKEFETSEYRKGVLKAVKRRSLQIMGVVGILYALKSANVLPSEFAAMFPDVTKMLSLGADALSRILTVDRAQEVVAWLRQRGVGGLSALASRGLAALGWA